jgi:CubicO group peptidase (beta-lactamase class C family)
VQKGKLSLGQKIKSIIPEFGETDKKDISLKNLLRHNSGLKDYLPFYKELINISFEDRKNALRDLLLKEPVLYPPGEKVLYSDLGFMILNWTIEKTAKMRLDRFLIQNVYKPLGIDYINGLFFIELEKNVARNKFAATEFCPWRNALIDGIVHDENAFVMGGIEGHSGLFGNVQNIYKLLSYLLSVYQGKDDLNIFSQDLVQTFLKRKRRNQRALGFDAPAPKNSSAGRYFSKTSVGHLGFTGTSFWMDIEKAIIIILLTNRVHPTRENVKIRDFRPILHDAIMEELIQ